MGYESNGYGTFYIRHSCRSKRDKIVKEIMERGFHVEDSTTDPFELNLSFYGWKLYGSEDELGTVLKYLNGEFFIEGDEQGDLWKLIFLNGELFNSMADIVYQPMKKAKSLEEPYLESE